MTMLRLTPKMKKRIPDRLAIFAALLLLVSSLAGVGGQMAAPTDGAAQTAAVSATEGAAAGLQTARSGKVKKNRGFKVSLLLFRSR